MKNLFDMEREVTELILFDDISTANKKLAQKYGQGNSEVRIDNNGDSVVIHRYVNEEGKTDIRIFKISPTK